MSSLSTRVRARLRDEMTRNKVSQQEVADLVNWTQSKVAQKLTGRTPITLDELETLAFAVGLQPTELVRDHGLEFCAEMTPSEMRVLERFRQLTPAEREAVIQLTGVAIKTRLETRRASAAKEIIPKRRG